MNDENENKNISFDEKLNIPNISQENYNEITFDSNTVNDNLNSKAVKRGEIKKQKEELVQAKMAAKTLADYPDVLEAAFRAGSAVISGQEKAGKTFDPEERELHIMREAFNILGKSHIDKKFSTTRRERDAIHDIEQHLRNGR